MQKLRIDFVSDVVCPWCAVGLYGLEEALRRTADVVTAEFTFQPFELNPGMRADGQNIDEHLAEKYGSGPAELAASREMLRTRAAGVGFAFNTSAHSRIYNTFDAHRLLRWAKTVGRQRELKHALLKANFTDGKNVSDPEVLIAVAASAGLDADQARAVLASGEYANDVREAEQLWLSRGIQGVPGIVINEKWMISGGQPPEVFEQVLRGIASESQSHA